jgi:protein phosphatase methylesterase 1
MSKKSAFSHFHQNQEKNEFEEKNEEEDEGEEEENANIINTNKEKTNKEEEKKAHDDPFDYSDDEDEVEDKIADLNSIPNYFEIPKPVNLFKPPLPPGASTSENPLLKKYAPLDWKTAFPTTYNICNNTLPIYISGNSGPNLICLHGAGHSGLSFAPLALANKNYRIISFDFRGHGFNTQTPSNDLSEKTLINDTIEVLNHVHEKYPDENLVIVGHSMGGSIATKTCCTILREEEKYKELYKKMQGLMVIDVVEGTAMDALPFMENIVNNRPERFNSIQKGIEYMYKSGTIKNLDSARISVPPLLREDVNNKGVKTYVFKTNLMESKPYWNEWFIGLTKAFLSCNIPKTLMLAGIERMDKDLTIAQMQGKYKLSILRGVGHIMHEDKPEEVMKVIKDFITTFRITPKEEEMKPIIGKLGNQDPNQKVIIPMKYDKWNANK